MAIPQTGPRPSESLSERSAGNERALMLRAALAEAGEHVGLVDGNLHVIAADQGFQELIAGPAGSALHEVLVEARASGHSAFRLAWSARAGTWLSLRARPVPQGLLVYASPVGPAVSGITTEVRTQQVDATTSLPNRLAFEADLDAAIATGRTFTLALLNLDRFRLVNDTHGHREGDRVLMRLGARMNRVLRSGDRLYRLSGDEFGCLLPGSPSEAVRRLRALRRVAASNVTIGVTEFRLGGCIGYASHPADGRHPELLHRRAETALHAARSAGRARTRGFDGQLERALDERQNLSAGLAEAIAGDQLFLLYQPQLDLRTGRTCGVEALVRWRHPEQGIILPGRFLPIASATGQLPALDRWVVRNVARHMPALADADFTDRVSINLSAQSLALPGLVRELRTCFAEKDRDWSGQIAFEFTESAVMRDFTQSRRTLQQLRECGFWVALDDFGTGFGSIEHLLRFPIDAAKIDALFIARMLENARSLRLVQGMVQLLKSLDLVTVAEGAECDEQRHLLSSLDCDRMQGHQFSHPLSFDDFVAFHQTTAQAVRPPRVVDPHFPGSTA